MYELMICKMFGVPAVPAAVTFAAPTKRNSSSKRNPFFGMRTVGAFLSRRDVDCSDGHELLLCAPQKRIHVVRCAAALVLAVSCVLMMTARVMMVAAAACVCVVSAAAAAAVSMLRHTFYLSVIR